MKIMHSVVQRRWVGLTVSIQRECMHPPAHDTQKSQQRNKRVTFPSNKGWVRLWLTLLSAVTESQKVNYNDAAKAGDIALRHHSKRRPVILWTAATRPACFGSPHALYKGACCEARVADARGSLVHYSELVVNLRPDALLLRVAEQQPLLHSLHRHLLPSLSCERRTFSRTLD